MTEAVLESGFARVAAGSWLTGRGQPAACRGVCTAKCLKGFVVPDRTALRLVETAGEAWFGSSERPFITRLDALPDEPLRAVSSKLLLAPASARQGAKALRLVPLSLNRALAVTALQLGWAVMATASRIVRVALEAEETLSVRPESLVAWIGRDPSGFCPKLSLLDMLMPRGPKSLVFTFHGPATVWFEGARLRQGYGAASRHRMGGFS